MYTQTVLEVKTFGVFSISRRTDTETLTISERDGFSRKLWGFLEYLVVFRKHGVTRTELIDAFWGDGHGGNPANNLKALVFRARNAMSTLGLTLGKDVILCEKNGYCFSNELTFNVDAERFESLCIAAEASAKLEEKLKNALAALRIYDGDFLSGNTDFSWAATLNTYYRSKYLKLCVATLALLKQANRHEEIIALCRSALTLEPYDESLHRSLIEALTASGAVQAAMQHYVYVVDMFISELEVSPSRELTALYHYIASASGDAGKDLYAVRDELEEGGEERSPLFCEYAAFRDIYRLEARSVRRMGKPCQLVMLSLNGLSSKQMTSGQIRSGMEYLKQAIGSNLRMNDLFSKYSSSQYLVLLLSADGENGAKAIDRVLRQFHAEHPKVAYTVRQTLIPVMPYRELSD